MKKSGMSKGRLEAFSDGVIAIIITIMVLEMKVPHGTDLADLLPLIPIFLSYVLSFIYVAIYWNNHHHLLQVTEAISGSVLWANIHLLFWLSLIPFVTGWMGENHFAPLPVMLYGLVLFACACAFTLLVMALLAHHDKNSTLARAMGRDFKGKVSLLIYAIAIAAACWRPIVACVLYVVVAIIWLVPDRRIEKAMVEK